MPEAQPLPCYSPDSIAGNDHEVVVIIYCQHFDVRQGRDHLFFWRQVLVPLVEVITCSGEEDRFLPWLGPGNATDPQTVRNSALTEAAPAELEPARHRSRSGCGRIDRNLPRVQGISFGEPNALLARNGQEVPLPVQCLFAPAKCHFPSSRGNAGPTAHGTRHHSEVLRPRSRDALSHVSEQGLQLTPAPAWLCRANTRRSFPRSSGCLGPDTSVQNLHHTAGFRPSQTLGSQSSLEETHPQL